MIVFLRIVDVLAGFFLASRLMQEMQAKVLVYIYSIYVVVVCELVKLNH